MERCVQLIDRLIKSLGEVAACAVVFIIALIVLEVASRALFNMTFSWARESAQWLSGLVVFVGGANALLQGKFVRVDAYFGTLSPRKQAAIDLVLGSICMALVCYVLVVYGGSFAAKAIQRMETTTTSWRGPVWIAKAMIPLGGALLGLVWISISYKNIQKYRRNSDLPQVEV